MVGAKNTQKILLLRHGIAEDRIPDELRELSAEGRQRLKAVAESLKGKLPPIDLYIESSFTRSQQSRAVVEDIWGSAPVILCPHLAPMGSTEKLQAWIAERTEACICVVGHEPQLSSLLALLLRSHETSFSFKKAGLAIVEKTGSQFSLKALLSPKYLLQ